MFDSTDLAPPIVFLHIPKTAGQTIHNELTRAIGAPNVSPVRVHTQVTGDTAQFPAGYTLYSGHIDWAGLDHLPRPRFVFSILRDPRERIASFYFYLRREAQRLSQSDLDLPQNLGKKNALGMSADMYFFGGTSSWKSFVRDHYDNFYCRYFGSRKIRAGDDFSKLPSRRKLRVALRNIEHIDWIYSVDDLGALEADLKTLYSLDVTLTTRRDNAGAFPSNEPRWPKLLEQFESDVARRQIEDFVTLDTALMSRLEL